jgi:hypothetical protein
MIVSVWMVIFALSLDRRCRGGSESPQELGAHRASRAGPAPVFVRADGLRSNDFQMRQRLSPCI